MMKKKYLIDTENNISNIDFYKIGSDATVLFFAPKTASIQMNILASLSRRSVDIEFKPVFSHIKNSVDVCILEYIYQDPENKDTQYVIVSRDKDYDKELKSFSDIGISVTRSPLEAYEDTKNALIIEEDLKIGRKKYRIRNTPSDPKEIMLSEKMQKSAESILNPGFMNPPSEDFDDWNLPPVDDGIPVPIL